MPGGERLDEDLTPQRERVAAARAVLHEALRGVAYRANNAASVAGSKAKRPPAVDLGAYLSAHQAVMDAEEHLVLALTDLASASGEDV